MYELHKYGLHYLWKTGPNLEILVFQSSITKVDHSG